MFVFYCFQLDLFALRECYNNIQPSILKKKITSRPLEKIKLFKVRGLPFVITYMIHSWLLRSMSYPDVKCVLKITSCLGFRIGPGCWCYNFSFLTRDMKKLPLFQKCKFYTIFEQCEPPLTHSENFLYACLTRIWCPSSKLCLVALVMQFSALVTFY